MNKVEQLHLQTMEDEVGMVNKILRPGMRDAACSSAKITEDIALKFYEWSDTSNTAVKFWRNNKVNPTMDGSHYEKLKELRAKLYQEFLKELNL